MQGARCGTWSRVSRIMPWAEGRRPTAKPPRHPKNKHLMSTSYNFSKNFVSICIAFIFITPIRTLLRWTLLSLSYRWRNWGPERLSNLPEIMQKWWNWVEPRQNTPHFMLLASTLHCFCSMNIFIVVIVFYWDFVRWRREEWYSCWAEWQELETRGQEWDEHSQEGKCTSWWEDGTVRVPAQWSWVCREGQSGDQMWGMYWE